MSFFENLQSFISLAKETNFDLGAIYSQNPESVYVFLLVVLALILIIIFFVNRSIKISNALKLVTKIQNSKDVEDYSSKLTKLATELPKRGLKVANSLNEQKKDILNQELALLKNLDIKEKISKYEQIASQYTLMATNSKKYKIEDLTSFYEEKSKTLLSEDLFKEIEKYYKNARFNQSDLENINAIVSYSNRTSNPNTILNPLVQEIDKFSLGFNLELFKFINSLDKQKSSSLYHILIEKFNKLLTSGEDIVSDKILTYMLEDKQTESVYNYISTLENKTHLKNLYNTLFAKTQDLELDLAFVANKTKIDVDYKTHIDNKLTQNWKDLALIKHIINSVGVLETIGHIDYRNVLERIEKLETQDENNKAVALALETARRAETIAIEAKTLARSK